MRSAAGRSPTGRELLLDEVALGVGVLGEDEDAAVSQRPPVARSGQRLARSSEAGARDPRVAAGGGRPRRCWELHLGRGAAARSRPRAPAGDVTGVPRPGPRLLGLDLVLGQLGAVVVGAGELSSKGRRFVEGRGAASSRAGRRERRCTERAGEGLDGGEQPLLERDQHHQHRGALLDLGGRRGAAPARRGSASRRERQLGGVVGEAVDLDAARPCAWGSRRSRAGRT
jgi:hypothetical protein